LIATAEETSRIMWRAYEVHMDLPRILPDWEAKASEIFERCMACDQRLAQLKASRTRTFGPGLRQGSSDPGKRVHSEHRNQEEFAAAEWEVKKLRLLLERHRKAPRTEQDWSLKETRLQKALAAAEARLFRFGDQGAERN
jgi:hypothetical protein